MYIFKKSISIILACSVAGCLSLTDVEIGTLIEDEPGQFSKFRCENGYKGSIKYRNNGRVSIAFSDGKDNYVTYINKISTESGTLYVNDKRTLKWHEQSGTNIFTYPARDYSTTGKLLTTRCQKY
ncbi:hypothetical protein ACFSAV_02375 [Pasteurella oralis]|uniref:C-type lysozyme inhibitor domain-containing protein n=1 Tax=Pasteurella oralis TaxID=1071947 RepID=A0ABW4NU77_9PAST|nr:hypothetical protein [Pasteurella oralis]MDO5055386.1 hypothetical protein [Pasteurella oralis]